MRRNAAKLLMLVALCTPLILHAQPSEFSFAVLMHILRGSSEDSTLRAAIEDAQVSSPAFMVVNGIKTVDEACTDRRFQQRKAILAAASTPVFLSMAGTDWMTCRDAQGRSSAIERLTTLREQLYGDSSWNGARQIAMTRQSSTKAYRSYSENTRWEFGNVLFSTFHLPAPNNGYLAEAGRNSEFEDRQIANRNWLRRIFAVAKHNRLSAIVIFCDGKLLSNQPPQSSTQRDGFDEIRHQLRILAQKFDGSVLVIQSLSTPVRNLAPTSFDTEFVWHGNLGELSLPAGHTMITVNPALSNLFEIKNEERK